MSDHPEQLLNELRQICAQYQREVPSGRRPWPQSIRGRIFRLKELGVGFNRIASETGIPVMTMYCWRPDGTTRKSKKKRKSQEAAPSAPAPAFLPVPVRPLLRTVKNSGRQKERGAPRPKGRPGAGVTVVLPNGTRLEGLDARSALALIRELARHSS